MKHRYIDGFSDLSPNAKKLFLESLEEIRKAGSGSDELLKATFARCEGYVPAEGSLMTPDEWKRSFNKAATSLYGKHLINRLKKF